MSKIMLFVDERDTYGNLTDLAIGIDALVDNGCDCDGEGDRSCFACLCEAAMLDLVDRWQDAREEIEKLKGGKR